MSCVQKTSERKSRNNVSAKKNGSDSRPKSSVTQPPRSGTGRKLKDKEEEFRKLNAQLEEKTAVLVGEAEEIMRGNLSTPPPPMDGSETTGVDLTFGSPVTQDHKRRGSSTKRPIEDMSLDIERTVRQLEKRLEQEEELKQDGVHKDYQTTSVVPEVAEDLGSEAMIRFLKAKLRVLQEEHEQATMEISHKDKQLHSAEAKVKELSEKNKRLEKTQHSIQLQISKYQKLSVEAQQKCDGLETQLISLKRELEGQKSTHCKTSAAQSAVEVRLNRATEELDKYRTLYNRLKSDTKDLTRHDKIRIEELESDKKVLERQKTELITAFKKQMKLIDVLKKQKVHLEAARMLAFTEEEFMKALDTRS